MSPSRGWTTWRGGKSGCPSQLAFRILVPWLASGQDHGYPKTNWQKHDLADEIEVGGRKLYNEHVDNRGDNHILARKIAAESTV